MDFSTMTLTPTAPQETRKSVTHAPIPVMPPRVQRMFRASLLLTMRSRSFVQLKDSNLDLTGHPLAKTFEALAPVPTGEPDTANEAVEPTAEGAESTDDGATGDVHEAVPEDAHEAAPGDDSAVASTAPAADWFR